VARVRRIGQTTSCRWDWAATAGQVVQAVARSAAWRRRAARGDSVCVIECDFFSFAGRSCGEGRPHGDCVIGGGDLAIRRERDWRRRLQTPIACAKERGRVRKWRAGSGSDGACGIAKRGWERATPGCRVDRIDLDVLVVEI
jgi:hypothetical protein